MPPKAKQEQETQSNNWAAIEEAAHNRAKEIAKAVLGPLANPAQPDAYAPTFTTINKVREMCIFMNEDGDLDDDLIEETTVELRLAIGWAQGIAGQPVTVDEAFKAFEVLSAEDTLEEKIDELLERVS